MLQIAMQDAAQSTVHPYTSPARVIDGQLSYVAVAGSALGEL
jgi:hypothetical protein